MRTITLICVGALVGWAFESSAQSIYTPYTFTTVAGGGGGSGSADGTGSNARFYDPSAVAVDRAGNIYVADTGNDTIRKITPPGVVTTLAGLAESKGSTDGTGSMARFCYPEGIAVDRAGNVYVADSLNDTIRKVTPEGVVTTLAGQAGQRGSDDGKGNEARFNGPDGVAVDRAGNIYVADTGNDTIRKITPDSTVTTLAGLAGASGSEDGKGSAARFGSMFGGPSGIAVDDAGNIYVADKANQTIRKITPTGVVSTLAGIPGSKGAIDGAAKVARFNEPDGVTVDKSGNVYVADFNNHTIRKVTPQGTVITLAGLAGSLGFVDGRGSAARFGGVPSFGPSGVAVGPDGNIYVADSGNDAIRKVTPDGAVTTLAGLASGTGSADGTGTSARFRDPGGAVVDNAGNLYVADTGNDTIRKMTPAGVVSTLAGMAGQRGSVDGTGKEARFTDPSDVAVDSAGNVYVADSGNDTIRKVSTSGVVATLAGLAGHPGSTDGTGSAARFGTKDGGPEGIAVDTDGNVYVADTNNHTIRKVTPEGVVTTLAGSAAVSVYGWPTGGSTDGTGSEARFNYPWGIAVNKEGTLYVADSMNNTIRKVTPTGVVTTLAGQTGLTGPAALNNVGSADGTGNAARFWHPESLAVDQRGNVYVADSSNRTIRKITPAGTVKTLAGKVGSDGNADGTGSQAQFGNISGLAVDNAGNVYVVNSDNSTILKGHPAVHAP